MKNRLMPVVLLAALLLLPSLAQAATTFTPCRATTVPPVPRTTTSADAYQTGFDYMTTFYPRWFYFYQAAIAPCNQLIGPDKVTALYHSVVAINVDTLYASMIVGLKDDDPVIVTVPSTSDNYSILQLDGYGDVFPGIPNNQPGVYGLTGPGWQGVLPPGVSQIKVPYNFSELAVRADKFVDKVDMTAEADKFRRALQAVPLSEYCENCEDTTSGQTNIVPEAFFAIPYKRIADELATKRPLAFLETLQTAVLAGTTQPMTPDELALSNDFNALFRNPRNWRRLAAGARAAHAAILANYAYNTLSGTNWITFTDIGEWADTLQGHLNRSSIAEYIQAANNHDAAAYYHTFRDGSGDRLDGSSQTYVLTFPPNGQPDYQRFWSVTAYLPESIELVPNLAKKFAVASYTPGLVTGTDGSVTIVVSARRPAHFPEANWLPVPRGPFNIMLHVYGPKGTVSNNSYFPPPIQRNLF